MGGDEKGFVRIVRGKLKYDTSLLVLAISSGLLGRLLGDVYGGESNEKY